MSTPPSTTPCELWLDACVLHQRTTFLFFRHPTCWASSQWSHTVSSTPCHGAWTSAPLSAYLSIECKCTAPQIETPTCTHRTTTHQFFWKQQHTCSAVGGSPHKTPHFHPRHPPLHPPEWLSQEQTGSGLTASSPVWDVYAPVCTNEVCPPLRPVSVAPKNKLSTMLSSNVQSIDLLMDCMVWRFWTMRQLIGCSTSAPRSSAAKQWLWRTGSKAELGAVAEETLWTIAGVWRCSKVWTAFSLDPCTAMCMLQ